MPRQFLFKSVLHLGNVYFSKAQVLETCGELAVYWVLGIKIEWNAFLLLSRSVTLFGNDITE